MYQTHKLLTTKSTHIIGKTELGSDFWGVVYNYHGVINDSLIIKPICSVFCTSIQDVKSNNNITQEYRERIIYSEGLIEINFAETKKLVHLEERKGNKGVQSA